MTVIENFCDVWALIFDSKVIINRSPFSKLAFQFQGMFLGNAPRKGGITSLGNDPGRRILWPEYLYIDKYVVFCRPWRRRTGSWLSSWGASPSPGTSRPTECLPGIGLFKCKISNSQLKHQKQTLFSQPFSYSKKSNAVKRNHLFILIADWTRKWWISKMLVF